MKNYILHIISLTLFVALLSGCFADKGNYEYSEINEIVIDTTNFQMEYNVVQFDSLKIKPEIMFSLKEIDNENLEYTWTIFNNIWNNSVSEVISRERNLKYKVAQMSSGTSYSLVLDVKDKTSGIAAQSVFKVWISSEIVSGWLVLHTSTSGSDIDYIATKNAVPTVAANRHYRNVFSSINGGMLKGNTTFISPARRNSTVINSIYIGTDSELYRIAGKTFKLEYTSDGMFTILPQNIKPQAYECGSTQQFLINDGQLHSIVNQSAWEATFSYALQLNSTLNASKIDLAPFIYIPAAYASSTQFAGVFYDKLKQRFVILPYSSMPITLITKFKDQASGAIFDVNNIGKEMLFFEKGFNNYGYAIFKDNGSANRWLYVANFNKTMSDNMAIAKYDMSAATDIENAKFYSCGNRGEMLLYATERDIYTYDYSGSNTSIKINSPFATGEVITSMKIYKPGTSNSLGDANGALLYVATWNGTEGKLYEFSLNETNGYLRNTQPLNIFTGFGKIVDMNYKLQGTGTGS